MVNVTNITEEHHNWGKDDERQKRSVVQCSVVRACLFAITGIVSRRRVASKDIALWDKASDQSTVSAEE